MIIFPFDHCWNQDYRWSPISTIIDDFWDLPVILWVWLRSNPVKAEIDDVNSRFSKLSRKIWFISQANPIRIELDMIKSFFTNQVHNLKNIITKGGFPSS